MGDNSALPTGGKDEAEASFHEAESGQASEQVLLGEWLEHVFQPRTHHASCSDGSRVFVFGGNSSSAQVSMLSASAPESSHNWLQSMWVYTPSREGVPPAWREMGLTGENRTTNRRYHQMVTDGKFVYVFGGHTPEGKVSGRILMFDIEKEQWKVNNEVHGRIIRCVHHSMSLIGRNIYVYGGLRVEEGSYIDALKASLSKSLECYNLDTNKWTSVSGTGSLPPRLAMATLVAVNKYLYLFGGYTLRNQVKTASNELYRFDTLTSVWEKIETGLHSPSCRYGHACTGWSDGFWLAGGANDSKQVDDKLVYQYVASRSEWRIIRIANDKKGPLPRQNISMEYIDKVLYFIGGHREGRVVGASPIPGNSFDCHSFTSLIIGSRGARRYTLTISTDFMKGLDSKEFSDLTIIVEGKPIYVHKIILVLRCPYFRLLFGSQMKESTQSSIEIHDCTYESMMNLLSFIYSSTIPTTTNVDQVVELLGLSGRFQINELRECCIDVLTRFVDEETVSSLLQVG